MPTHPDADLQQEDKQEEGHRYTQAMENCAAVPLISPDADLQQEDNSWGRRRYQRSITAPTTRSCHNVFVDDVIDSSSQPDFKFTDKLNAMIVFLVLFVYLGAGTLCFYLVRKQLDGKHTNGFVDSMYFCIVTMTTLGYGDIVPSTTLSKLLACLYVFIGMAIIGVFLSKVVDHFVEKQGRALTKALNVKDKRDPAEILKEVMTHRTMYKFLLCLTLLVLFIISGVLALIFIENMSLINAFYCVCSTITTLGYGDESFLTEGGRIFAIFWIPSSTICLAQFFLYITELYAESRQRTLLKWVLGRKLTLMDIQTAGLDNGTVVSAAEFILYKLKEMEKINEEDIAPLMKCFKSLDIDNSGTLTSADIICIQ